MENRKRLIELLTAVRYTTNDIEKVADEICLLFNVVGSEAELVCSDPTHHAMEIGIADKCNTCGAMD